MAYRLRRHGEQEDEQARAALGASSVPALRMARRRRRLQRRRRARARTMAVLPSLFTLANAVCGFVSIFLASRPVTGESENHMPFGWTPLTFAALAIFLGMVFDAVDGRIARLTGQTSELGEQLDSMSDMVTFGVAPAFLALMLVVGSGIPYLSETQDVYFARFALVVASIYVVCAALRLARFNVEVNNPEEIDHLSFKGLPSPGAAGTVASLVLLHQHFLADYTRKLYDNPDIEQPLSVTLSAIGMVLVTLLVAIAMVSRLRYVHVLNRYVRGRVRFETIVAMVFALSLLALSLQKALAGMLVVYALSAPALALWRRVMRRGDRAASGDAGDADSTAV